MKRAGSKSRLVQHLLPHLAAVSHECFVEPFCGTCSVLLAKPRSRVEVVNDTDGELVNALRQIQHHRAAVLAELKWVPNARAEFISRRDNPGRTEIQRAASYLYTNNISFSGGGTSYGVCRTSGGGAVTPISRIIRQTAALQARLEGVSVEQLDWRYCIELYDSERTLFFCDPPYVGTNQSGYAAWSIEQVAELAKVLGKIRGRFVATLNDSPEVRAAFAGCRFQPLVRTRHLGGATHKHRPLYHELIITQP